MNKEDKMPTYGELYAENFRLEHNYRVVSEREVKLQNNWKQLKIWLSEQNFDDIDTLMVLDKMEELEKESDVK